MVVSNSIKLLIKKSAPSATTLMMKIISCLLAQMAIITNPMNSAGILGGG